MTCRGIGEKVNCVELWQRKMEFLCKILFFMVTICVGTVGAQTEWDCSSSNLLLHNKTDHFNGQNPQELKEDVVAWSDRSQKSHPPQFSHVIPYKYKGIGSNIAGAKISYGFIRPPLESIYVEPLVVGGRVVIY